MSKRVHIALPYLLLLLITAAVYSRTITFGFIRWDDQELVSENPNLYPPTLQHVTRFWTAPYAGLYTPATYTLWSAVSLVAMDKHDGMNPHWFHAVNVLLHLLSAALVFSILKFLTCQTKGSICPALVGALIFALHPLQVEPIAWISGMNNLLAGALSLLAIRLYLSPRRGFYLLASSVYLLALLSKPSVVVAPLILMVIEIIIVHRPWRSVWLRAGTWLLMAIPLILLTHWAQPIQTFDAPALIHRPLIAIDAVGFYLQKLFLPINLSIDYARTPQRLRDTGAFYLTASMVLVFAVLLFVFRRRSRWLLGAALVFMFALLPTLGLVAFGFQEFSTTADRYIYLAMLGPAIAAAWVLPRIPAGASYVAAAIVPLLLGALSIHQIAFWKNTQTLTAHALQIDPGSAITNMIRGAELSKAGHPTEAIDCYHAAIIRIPKDATLHFNLANALEASGRIDQARMEYELAIHLKPDVRARAYHALGLMFVKSNDRARAAIEFSKSLQIDPHYAPAREDLRRLQMPRP